VLRSDLLTYFFGYADYSPSLDALNYQGRANAVNTIASENIRSEILSPTGAFYNEFIEKNP